MNSLSYLTNILTIIPNNRFDVGNIHFYLSCHSQILYMVTLVFLLRYLHYGTLYQLIFDIVLKNLLLLNAAFRTIILNFNNIVSVYSLFSLLTFRFIYVTHPKYLLESINNLNNKIIIIVYIGRIIFEFLVIIILLFYIFILFDNIT